MKKIISSIITLTLFLSTSAQIQRTTKVKAKVDSAEVSAPATTNDFAKPSKTKKRELFKELNLSRTQMKELKGMRKDAKATKENIESNAKLTEQEKKQQLKAAKIAQLKKMQQILTPEQLTKLKALKNEGASEQMEEMEMDN